MKFVWKLFSDWPKKKKKSIASLARKSLPSLDKCLLVVVSGILLLNTNKREVLFGTKSRKFFEIVANLHNVCSRPSYYLAFKCYSDTEAKLHNEYYQVLQYQLLAQGLKQ